MTFRKGIISLIIATINGIMFSSTSVAESERLLLFPSIHEIMSVPFLIHNKDNVNSDVILKLEGHIVQDGAPLQEGLVWRIFKKDPLAEENLNLVAESFGGGTLFTLEAGEYFVHLSFGNAVAIDSIFLSPGEKREVHLVLNAGGVRLNATLSTGIINENQVKFAIYVASYNNNNEECSLVLQDIHTGSVVRLNENSYRVVSHYGTENAVVRSDIQIKAGSLIEMNMQHRAAQITLRLVRVKGGEALADTRWVVMDGSGDVVCELASAYASIILADGEYSVMAQHKNRLYHKEFLVSSGHDQVIDILIE